MSVSSMPFRRFAVWACGCGLGACMYCSYLTSGDPSEVPAAAVAVLESTATTSLTYANSFFHPVTDERIEMPNIKVMDEIVAPWRIATTT